MLEASGFDIWLEYTDHRGAKAIRHHRVWDKERFFRAKLEESTKGKPDECFTFRPVDKPPIQARR